MLKSRVRGTFGVTEHNLWSLIEDSVLTPFWVLWSVAGHASTTMPVLKITACAEHAIMVGFSGAEIDILNTLHL